jgi:ketosteroid isomerase-like protein
MSQDNVGVVRASYDALNRGDVSSVLDFADPDAKFNSLIGPLEGGDSFRGPEGGREYLALMSGAFADVTWEVEHITEVDDEQVIAYVRVRGRGATSGAGIDQRTVAVFKFRDGKVLSVDSYMHEAEALVAVGLGE